MYCTFFPSAVPPGAIPPGKGNPGPSTFRKIRAPLLIAYLRSLCQKTGEVQYDKSQKNIDYSKYL